MRRDAEDRRGTAGPDQTSAAAAPAPPRRPLILPLAAAAAEEKGAGPGGAGPRGRGQGTAARGVPARPSGTALGSTPRRGSLALAQLLRFSHYGYGGVGGEQPVVGRLGLGPAHLWSGALALAFWSQTWLDVPASFSLSNPRRRDRCPVQGQQGRELCGERVLLSGLPSGNILRSGKKKGKRGACSPDVYGALWCEYLELRGET